MKNKEFEKSLSKKMGEYKSSLPNPALIFDEIQLKLEQKRKGRRMISFLIMALIVPACIAIVLMLNNTHKNIQANLFDHPGSFVHDNIQTGYLLRSGEDTAMDSFIVLKSVNNLDATYLKYVGQQNRSFHAFNIKNNQDFVKHKKTIQKQNKVKIPKDDQNNNFFSNDILNKTGYSFADTSQRLIQKKNEVNVSKDSIPDIQNDFFSNNVSNDIYTLFADTSQRSITDSVFITPYLNEFAHIKPLPVFRQPLRYIETPTTGYKVTASVFAHVSIIGAHKIITPGPAFDHSNLDSLFLSQQQNVNQFTLSFHTGIGSRIRIKKYFSVTVGINYAYDNFYQTIDTTGGTFVSYAIGGSRKQQTESIEIPVTIGLQIPVKKLSIHMDLGVAPSFVLFSSYVFKKPGTNIIDGASGWLGDYTPYTNSYNLHLVGGVLLNYSISEHFKIFAGFDARYSFFSMFTDQYSLTQRSYGLGGKFGLEFQFGRKNTPQ